MRPVRACAFFALSIAALGVVSERAFAGNPFSLDDDAPADAGAPASRGPIVAQDALYAHLKAHPRFKAGIDVWWRSPKSGEKFSLDYPFFELPNFLASPHNSDGVPEARGDGQEHAFSNVIRYLDGEPLERVVNRADYLGFRPMAGH